jgi:hypothetical protein
MGNIVENGIKHHYCIPIPDYKMAFPSPSNYD